MRKEIEKLLGSDLSAYAIFKKTGVDASSIQRLRNGERKLGNLTLDKAEKLYNYQKQIEDKREV